MVFSKMYSYIKRFLKAMLPVAYILLFIILFFSFAIVYPQDTTLNNYTGIWTNDLSWTDGSNPGTSGLNTDIVINGTISHSGDIETVNGDLTVNDTLLIYGNLTLGNNSDFTIANGGVAIVYGDYLSKNKVNTIAGGYFVVMGEFEQQGANDQGSFDVTTGSIFIYDTTPQIKTGAGYADLSCSDPSDYPNNCSYGDETDFQSEPVSDFVNAGGYTISASGPLDVFGFYASVDLSIPDEGDSYQWYKDGLPVTTGNTNLLTATTSGDYYVEISVGSFIFETPVVSFSFIEPELWLKAESGISLSVSNVTQWDDNSLNSFSASQPGSSSRPEYLNNPDNPAFNYQPFIEFDGNNDRLALDNSYNANDFDQIYVFTIFKTDFSGGGDFDNWSFIDYDRSEFFNFYSRGDGTLGFSYNGSSINDSNGTSQVNDDIPHIGLAVYDNNKTNDEQIYLDGAVEILSDREAAGYKIGTNANTRYGYIGDGSEAGSFNSGANNNFYDGEIAEILYFKNLSFSFFELNKIHSYFGLKYGIQLQMNDDPSTTTYDERDYHATDNTVTWDFSGNEGYNNNIAGIGRDDEIGLNKTKSRNTASDAAIEIENPSSIASDLSFLIWGSNDLTGLSSSSPASYEFVSSRKWKVNINGTSGTVDITIDIEKAGLINTGNTGDYALLIDSDDDFSAGAIEHTTGVSITGNQISFSGVNLSDNDFLGLAINNVNTPGGLGVFPELWYKADVNVSLSGSDVSAWKNNSLSIIDASQAASDEMPGYINDPIDDAFNYEPYITFDGSNDRLAIDLSYSNADFDQVYVFSVFKTDFSGSDYNDNWAFLDFDRSEFFDTYIRGDDGTLGFSYNTSSISDTKALTSLNDDLPHIGLVVYDNTLVEEQRIFVDGTNEFSNDNEAIGVKIGSGAETRYGILGDGSEAVGFNGSGNNIFYDGEIAEIIYFKNESLSALEINKIQSYLSLKYGVPLRMEDDPSTPAIDERDYHASDNTVIWDFSANAGFNNHIAGVGRDDQSGLDKIKSRSKDQNGALRIEKTSAFSSDLEFIITGNNGEEGAVFSGPDTHPTLSKRIWKVEITGISASLDLSFDLSAMNFDVSGDVSNFVLLIDDDNDFTSGSTSHLTGIDLTGNILSFTDVTLSNGQYFALAASGVTAPGQVINDLKIWLKADQGAENASGLSATDGEAVTTWRESINGLDYVAVPGPTYQEEVLNFNPAIEILSGGFNAPAGAELSDDWTIFFVAQKLDSDIDGRLFDGHTGNYLWNYHDVHWRGIYLDNNPREYNSGVATDIGTTDLHLVNFKRDNATGQITDRADGNDIKTWNSTNSASGIRIDINQGSYASQSSDSRIGEMIIYDRSLNISEIEQIESYLSIKYGINKTGNYLNSEGTIIWDATSNAGYLNNIAGIGRDDGSDLNQLKSKSIASGGALTVEKAGGFSNNLDYLIWGSNQEVGIEQNAPSGYSFISSRKWKISTSGSPGNIDLTIDMADLEIINTGDISNYALFIDADGDFTSGAAEHAGVANIVGDQISFSNVSLNSGDHISLALKDIGTPFGVNNIASAAFSLRRIVEGFNGAAINVRRSSDNATRDIFFNASGELDETALLSFVGSGDGYVRIWYDQSGYNNHAYQATNDAWQPMIVSGGSMITLNGKPSVLYDGTDDQLIINYNSQVPENTFSNFIIAETGQSHQIDSESTSGTAGTSGQNYLLGAVHGGSDAGQGISMGTNGVSNYEHASGYMPATAVYSGPVFGATMIELFYTDRQPEIYLNGALMRTGQTSAKSLVTTSSQIGAGNYGEFNGHIPELIVFDDTLSESDRVIIECSQSDYFNIDISIPGFQILNENQVIANGCLYAEEEVVWRESSLVNMYANGMSLQKVSGGDNWNANASSLNQVYDNGYLSFVATATNMRRMIGLSNTDASNSYNTIDYAIYLRNDGNIFVYENGSNRGGYGSYSVGDTFFIKVESGTVKYYQNNNLIYISGVAPTLPLIVDVSSRYEGSVVDFVRVVNLSGGSFTATLFNAGVNPVYQWKLNGSDVGSGLPDYSNVSLVPGDTIECDIIPDYPLCGTPYSSNKIYIKEVPAADIFNYFITASPAPSACSHAVEDVAWDMDSETNVNISGSVIEKVQGGNNYNAGASSLNKVSDNGFLQFIATETNNSRIVGLSDVDVNANYNTIDFGLQLRSNGYLYVYESGSNRFTIGTYSTGDTLKIHIKEGVVHYYQNGELKYISGATPNLPLLADISMYHTGATVSDVKIANYSTGTYTASANNAGSNPVWQWQLNGVDVGSNAPVYTNTGLVPGDTLICFLTPDLVGCNSTTYASNVISIKEIEDPASIDFFISTNPAVTACQFSLEEVSWQLSSIKNISTDKNNIRKIQGGNSWNAGAASLNTVSDYGYMEVIATETNLSRMIGLSDTSLNENYNTINFALFLRSNGYLYVYENGANRFTIGTYSTGDTLRIQVKDGVVEYYQNEELKYISGQTPNLPMVVDASLYHSDATLNDVRISNYSDGLFTAVATNAGSNPVYQWQLNGINVGTNSPTYSNTSLGDGDSLICILYPDLGGCGTASYNSNLAVIRENQNPASIDFYISADVTSSACQFSTEEVSWKLSSIENLQTDGNNLEKIQGGSSWNGGASSLNTVSDFGYLQFVASENNRARAIGLSDTDINSDRATIDFAFYLRDNGVLYVFENGTNRATVGSYSTGDTLKIHIKDGIVHYYQNNELKYLSSSTPTLPMIVDAALYHQSSTISDVRVVNYTNGTFTATATNAGSNPGYQWLLNGVNVGINAPTYSNPGLSEGDSLTCILVPDLGGCGSINYFSNLAVISNNDSPSSIDFYISADETSTACQFSEEHVMWSLNSIENLETNGNNLQKIQGGNSWTGGASSLNTVSDFGYLQFVASETNLSRMVGLSNTSINSSYTTINYAFYLRNSGDLYVYENGSNTFTIGTYSTGDTLKIHVKEGVVHYYQNGELKYISSQTPDLPMVADVSIYHSGGTINDVRVVNYSSGNFTAIATNAGSNPVYQWRLNGLDVGGNSPNYSNPSLGADDSLICILTPDLEGCGSSNYTSNLAIIRENESPSSINFFISADTALNACQESEVEVSWDKNVLTNIYAEDNNLLKIQDNSWNGDAISLNKVYNNGSLSFTVGENNLTKAIGLSTANSGSGLNTIDFAFYLRNNGSFYIYENNSNRLSAGGYNAGDVFRIGIRNQIVYYFRNDNLVYISSVTPTLPMMVDVSMYHVGSTIQDVTLTNYSEGTYSAIATNAGSAPVYQWKLNGANVGINSPTYTNFTLSDGDTLSCELIPDLGGCSSATYVSNRIAVRDIESPLSIDFYILPDRLTDGCIIATEEIVWNSGSLVNLVEFEGELIKHTGGNSWNAGASSVSTIIDNGYIEFIAGETNMRKMIGFSNTDDNVNYNSIDFAWYLRNDGNVFIYENGSNRYSGGAYNSTDTFRIEVESGVVKYYINGSLRYTSGDSPVLPLIADISLNNENGTVPQIWVTNPGQATFTAYVDDAGTNPVYQWKVNGLDVGTNSPNYENLALLDDDIVTCTLTPDLNACSSASIESNSVSVRTGIDLTPPAIICPADVFEDASDTSCTALVTIPDPVYSDNCGIQNLTWRMTGATIDSSAITGINLIGDYEFNTGTTNINYEAVDVQDNSSSCSFTVTITDNTPPVAICKDTTIELDATGNASILNTSIDGGSTDNCGIASIVASKTNFDFTEIGTNTVTLTVTDIYGNISTCNTTVTVNASLNIPPASASINRDNICPGDDTIILSYNGGLLTPGSSAEWYEDPAFGSNVGSGNNLSIPAPSATTTYYVRFEGLFDTTSAVSATLNINPLPVVTFSAVPSPCIDAGQFNLTQGSPVGGTYSGTGITTSPSFNPAIAGVGNHLITYTYTDANSCVNSATQTITVNALPAPVVSGPVESCIDGSGVFSTPLNVNHSYSWSIAGATASSPVDANQVTIEFNTPGTAVIQVTETNDITGCTTTSAVYNVMIYDKPTIGEIQSDNELTRR